MQNILFLEPLRQTGYIDDETTKTTNLFSRLSGNPAVHFFRRYPLRWDTITFEINKKFCRTVLFLIVMIKHIHFVRAMRNLLFRQLRIMLIHWLLHHLIMMQIKSRLLQALESTENFQHLMVPHERWFRDRLWYNFTVQSSMIVGLCLPFLIYRINTTPWSHILMPERWNSSHLHHQAYIDKTNAALKPLPDLQQLSVEALLSDWRRCPKMLGTAVQNHGGATPIIHCLAVIDSNWPDYRQRRLTGLFSQFGGYAGFQEQFAAAAGADLVLAGPGW